METFDLLVTNFTISELMVIGGIIIGSLFGFISERINFCSRSAIKQLIGIQDSQRDKYNLIQLLIAIIISIVGFEVFSFYYSDLELSTRYITSEISIGGIFIGTVLFGIGAGLCRGCLSRQLILFCRGNLRSLFTILISVIVAWSAITGILSYPRRFLSEIGKVEINFNNNINFSIICIVTLLCIILVNLNKTYTKKNILFFLYPSVIGILVSASFYITGIIGGEGFDPIMVEGLSFISPLVNTFSYIVYSSAFDPGFGVGFILGAIIGATFSSLLGKRIQIQYFEKSTSNWKYFLGAGLMGFGGVVSGGCAASWLLTGGAVGNIGVIIAFLGFVLGIKISELKIQINEHIFA